MRRLLKNTGVHPETIITGKLASYRATLRDFRIAAPIQRRVMRGIAPDDLVTH